MDTANIMLQVDQLRCRLGAKEVLRGVNLTVPQGELHCLVGPNGAGKTTLLRCVTGLLSTWQGSIAIAGRDVRHLSRRQMAQAVALVPQGGIEPLPFTVKQFVLMGRYAYLHPLGRYSHEDEAVVAEALDAVQATELAARPLNELSGGERQRAVLARALAQGSPLMLLDEPTAFLDLDGQTEVLQLMRSMVDGGGKAALAVTHDLNLAAAYADRIHLMKDGAIVFEGTPAQALTPEVIHRVYRSPLEVLPNAGDDRPRVFIIPPPSSPRRKA
jgi:iron complex transport system ATP-binding protein